MKEFTKSEFADIRRMFLGMLDSLDVEEACKNSTINHHVNGVDYLCLKRDPEGETYKLYIIDRPTNPNSGWLVNPHTHRYNFTSYMFHGRLQHIRFRKRQSGIGLQREKDWVECLYTPYNRTAISATYLRPCVTECIERGDSYYVGAEEIHTLKMYDDAKPVLLGLVQGPDVRENSHLFLPASEYPNMNKPTSMPVVLPRQLEQLRDRAKLLMEL